MNSNKKGDSQEEFELARELYVLAKKNKTYAVRQFLETHDWVNPDLYKVTDGRTALHDTAFKGNAGICECLLEFKADVNCQKTTGWTALHHAAYNGNGQAVHVLLDYDAAVNLKNNEGWTALHSAVKQGHSGITRMLIDYRADVNETNQHSLSSLHIACKSGNVDCVKVLLEESDADLNMKTKMGKTARDLAMLQKHTSVVAMLDAHLKRGRTRPQEAKRAPNVIVSANVKNQWSKPAALKAVMSGSQPVTTLNRGVSAEVKAPVRQMQRQNSAPEPVALTQADFDEAYALSQELCELTKRNANLDIYLQAHPEVDVNLFRDGLGQTALHNATYRKRIDSVRSLLEYNADVNQTKKNGWSSLNEAAGNGHSDILELLIDHGADLNHKNNSGWTGIHLAVRKGHMQCISVLIRAGCDLTVRTPKGDTPRELASTMKGKDIVAFFDREKKLYDQERKLNPPAPAPAPVQQPVQVPVQVPVLPAQPQQPIGMTRQQQQQQHQLRKQHPAMELSRQLFELTARNDQNAAMQLLREQPKVNPNLYRDDQGVTSLHRASANGNDVLMSVLLTAKANVNLQSPDGLSPIHRCANNNSACARLLLEKKANVELQSERGATGLMHASMAGNQGVVLTLLESGASVSQTDNDGQQALHYCGLVGATPVAQMLLEARADVNAQDARGDTALHTVSKQANFPRNTASFVDLLIRANVDTGRKNNLGQSARDLCAMRKDLVDVKLRLDSLSQQNQHQQLLDSFMQPVNANSPQGHQEINGNLNSSGASSPLLMMGVDNKSNAAHQSDQGRQKPLEIWSNAEVVAWATEMGLGYFVERLREDEVEGADLLELKSEQDVISCGFTTKLIKARTFFAKLNRLKDTMRDSKPPPQQQQQQMQAPQQPQGLSPQQPMMNQQQQHMQQQQQQQPMRRQTSQNQQQQQQHRQQQQPHMNQQHNAMSQFDMLFPSDNQPPLGQMGQMGQMGHQMGQMGQMGGPPGMSRTPSNNNQSAPPGMGRSVARAPPGLASAPIGLSSGTNGKKSFTPDKKAAQLNLNKGMCVICLDKKADNLVIPCNHLCFCHQCSEEMAFRQLDKCPICQCKMENIVKIYIPLDM